MQFRHEAPDFESRARSRFLSEQGVEIIGWRVPPRLEERVPVRTNAWFARHRVTCNVANRIRRLNGPVIVEGQTVRGYHPHKRSIPLFSDYVSVRWFIATHGRAAFDAMPKEAFHRDGHRKAIKQEAVEDNLWLRNMRKANG